MEEKPRTHARPVTTRSRFVLEIASELVGIEEWKHKQAKLSMREQGAAEWAVTFFGSDAPSGIDAVANGEADVGIINPVEPLTMAYRGTGPFKKAVPFRVITIIPSADQLGFAVTDKTGLNSLADIREKRFPLRVSLRGQRDHSVQFMVEHTLAAYGFTVDDIRSWGGQVRYDRGLPDAPNRIGAVEKGEVDAIFDEAVNVWGDMALDLHMRFLTIEEPILKKLEEAGFRRGLITKVAAPKITRDVMSLDFSGWAVFTRADVPDDVITFICRGLEARKDKIPWQGQGPLPVERMCLDAPDTPLDVPLHPAAERFWRKQGYLR
ncbi:MAG TPA: TAXI family TRAP transporter solute-binding subunit [Candidatus Binatia bacterium]